MKDQHSTSNDHDEKPAPPGPKPPPGYIYYPEYEAWFAPPKPGEEPTRFWLPPKPSNNPPGIPPEFIYDPEGDFYYPPGEPSTFDAEADLRELREALNNRSEEERRKGLISVDQLRAAGALDVPPAWRKSLSDERDLFSELPEGDESPEEKKTRNGDADQNGEGDAPHSQK